MIAYLIKSKNGGWYPKNEDTQKYSKRRKPGTIIKADIKQEQNYKFHQKLMTLFNLVHNNLPPPEPVEFMGKMVTPNQTFEGTRKYMTVMAGYYDVVGYPNGSVRPEAKSLKFNKMPPEEREKLYSDLIDAALKMLPKEWSDEKINQVANEILRYDD